MALIHKKMAELVVKQLTGDISEEEIIEFNRIRSDSGLTPKELDELQDITCLASQLKLLNSFDLKASWEKVEATYSFKSEKASVWKFVSRVAAIILLSLSTWLGFQLSRPAHNGTISLSHNKDVYRFALDSPGNPDYVATVAPDRLLAAGSDPVANKVPNRLPAADKKSKQTKVADSCISFEDSDLQSIVQQLPGGEEYKVEYAPTIPPVMYKGALSRTTSVDALVQLVQLQSAFTIALEGKTIMVHL